MQKVSTILFIIFGFMGCAVLNKAENNSLTSGKQNVINIDNLRKKNLSEIDFTLTKVEIKIEEEKKNQKFLGNFKYQSNGKSLISLRNSTGMEGIRIYIDKDTVLANDRINKKVYFGSAEHLYNKYGISAKVFPVLFGDFIIDRVNNKIELSCKNGLVEINGYAEKNEIEYIADCTKNKITEAGLKDSSDKIILSLKYRNFKKIDGFYYPVIIEINDLIRKTKISLEIKKAEEYNGPELEFIPGNNYDFVLIK